jgi:hypothetical protein
MNLVWFVPFLLGSSGHSLRFILFDLDSPDLKFTVISFDRSYQCTSRQVSVQDCADVASHEIL